MGKYINPFTDIGFKKLFGQEVNKELLIDFLNVLLEGERQVADITFMDKEQQAESEEGRIVTFDILCREKDGTIFIVEMQNGIQGYFIDRALFYLCRMISNQGMKGSNWKFEICPVYGIYFLNFRLPPLSKLRTDVILADQETGRQIDGKLRQIFISMPYFQLEANECKTDLQRWIYLIKNMDILERMPFKAKRAALIKLLEVAEVEKLTPTERMRYDDRLKEYRDYVNSIEFAEEQGIKKGEAKGFKKGEAKGIDIGIDIGLEIGRKEVALQLKKAGIGLDVIARSTGLPTDEIERL